MAGGRGLGEGGGGVNNSSRWEGFLRGRGGGVNNSSRWEGVLRGRGGGKQQWQVGGGWEREGGGKQQ